MPEKVYAFNGSTAYGEWTQQVGIRIHGQKIETKLLIFEKMAHEMIVGMDVLRPLLDKLGAETVFGKHGKTEIPETRRIVKTESLEISIPLAQKLTMELYQEYDMFCNEVKEENLCTMRRHSIDTEDEKPVCKESKRVPLQYDQLVEEEIASLKSRGIIRPSTSPWRFGMVVAPKPNGKIRICIDYRPLNLITKKNAYPMPRIDEILDALSKAKILSIIDATSGYHQIAMEEEDIQKTAFAWKGQLYEYIRMPFGLCNAPATFQATMDAILQEINGSTQ